MENHKQCSGSNRTEFFIIRNRQFNLRLDLEWGRKIAGAKVTAWLAKNWSDQLWYVDQETGTIRWKKTKFCLELKDEGVVVNPYCHGNANQLWRCDGSLIRHGRNPDLVICISGDTLMPGAMVTAKPLAELTELSNQQFDFIHVPGLEEPHERRNFYIVSEKNSKVLDIRGEKTTTGAGVIIWPRKKAASKNQLWYFNSRGVICSTLNDYAIKAQNGSPATMVLYSRSQSEEWTFVENAIISKTGECLETAELEQYDGARVFASKFYNTPNQRWRLEFV